MTESGDAPAGYTRTTNCRDCSGLVSVHATTCPHCGAPLRSPAGYYADPENPDRKRYWDGYQWAAPKPTTTNANAKIAGGLGVGLLVLEPALYVILREFVSLPLRLVSMVALAGFALFYAVKALRETVRSRERGRALAVVGILFSVIWMILTLSVIVMVFPVYFG